MTDISDRDLIVLYFGLLDRLALLLERALAADPTNVPVMDAQRRLWEKKRRLRILAAMGQPVSLGGDD